MARAHWGNIWRGTVQICRCNCHRNRYAPGSGKRKVELNPSLDYVMQYGDCVLVLAEDDNTYECGPSNRPATLSLPNFEMPPPSAERLLLCGWRRDFDDMIMELDKWCHPGSCLTILSNHGVDPDDLEQTDEAVIEMQIDELKSGGMDEFWDQGKQQFKMENIVEVNFQIGDPTVRRVLEDMDLDSYDAGMVLASEPDTRLASDALGADSRVMVSMLLLRSIQVMRGTDGATLVSEILDPRTQDLMSLTKCSDSVVGNKLVSMILAQISEERDIGYVVEDLFSPEGCEMHLKDVRMFCAPNETLSFWDMVNRCQDRDEPMTLMGWIRKDDNPESSTWEAVVNPADKDTKLIWNGKEAPYGDLLIVISQD